MSHPRICPFCASTLLPILKLIAVCFLIIFGIHDTFSQSLFTELEIPVYPGGASYEVQKIAFADTREGNFSAIVDFSPGSGTEYHYYRTNDGGDNWELIFNEWAQFGVANGILFAINEDICLASYTMEIHYVLQKIARDGSSAYYSFPSPDWTVEPENISKFNDSVYFLTARHYDLPGGPYSYLYKIEGDSIEEVFNIQEDSVRLIKALFISADTGFVISRQAGDGEYVIRRTTDAGQSWENCFYGDTLTITDIASFNSSTGIISCSDGYLFRTVDCGVSWDPLLISPEGFQVNCLSFVDNMNGYCGGEQGCFYVTQNGGLTWKNIPFDETILDLQMIDPGLGYLTTNTNFYKFKDQSSITDNQDRFIASIYPNPAQEYVKIILEDPVSSPVEVILSDIFGRFSGNFQINGRELQMDLSSYSAGIYLLRIFNDMHSQTFKIVKH